MMNYDKDCKLCMSLKWKKKSYEMLVSSKSNKGSFGIAVLECGNGGSVSRTLSELDRPAFFKWVYDNYDRILSGELKLSDIPKFGEKTPKSWVSKICHILNPWDYPIIYDTHNRKTLGLTDNTWQQGLMSRRQTKDACSREEMYIMDSKLWAGLIPDLP